MVEELIIVQNVKKYRNKVNIVKGISKQIVISISKQKNEPKWMRDFRIKSYNCFLETPNPSFGPELSINFDDITYYKKVSDSISKKWDDVPKDVKEFMYCITIKKS